MIIAITTSISSVNTAGNYNGRHFKNPPILLVSCGLLYLPTYLFSSFEHFF
jgi:hypothetical protein